MQVDQVERCAEPTARYLRRAQTHLDWVLPTDFGPLKVYGWRRFPPHSMASTRPTQSLRSETVWHCIKFASGKPLKAIAALTSQKSQAWLRTYHQARDLDY